MHADFDSVIGRHRYHVGGSYETTPLSAERLAQQRVWSRASRAYGEALAEEAVRGAAGIAEGVAGFATTAFADYYRVKREREAAPADVVRLYDPMKRRRFAGGDAPVIYNNTGMTQYTESSSRRSKGRVKAAKLVQAEKKQNIFRWQGIRPFSGTRGMFSLQNTRNTTLNTYTYPHYLFDLTCITNAASNASIDYGVPCYQPLFVDPGTIQWDAVPGSSAAGLDYQNYGWIQEKQNPTSVSLTGGLQYPGEHSILEWADIRILLYGNTTSTTKFEIALVQFPDEDDHPENEVPAANGAVTTFAGLANTWSMEHVIKYQNWMRSYIQNPCHPPNATAGGPLVKYLSRKVFHLNPTSTNHRDDTPATHFHKMFWRPNRLCKWNYDEKRVPELSAAMQEDTIVGVSPTVRPYVEPRARVYLSIRAQVPYQGATVNGRYDAYTAGSSASFDLAVRTCHANI